MEQITTQVVDLSPFDQVISRLYVHKLFCFPFPDPDRRPEAVERLEQALSATVLKWPFITGDVVSAESDTQRNAVQIQYTKPSPSNIKQDVLVVKTLSDTEFPWTYQQLSEAGMPLSVLDKALLSSTVPDWTKPGEAYPVLSIQASFIDSGLILCFAFHHAVADGGSFCTFLKNFAAAVKDPPSPDSVVETVVPKRLGFIKTPIRDVSALESFPEYDYKNVPALPPSSGNITTRVLTFKATTIQWLEEAIKDELKNIPDGPTWVSNIAVVSGLIWVAVVRARQARLDPLVTTKMGIAVNIRSVMNPKLPEDYFGNAIVHTNATAKVSEFISSSAKTGFDKPPINAATVALAAGKMRRAVQGVDSAYVHERLKAYSAVSDPAEVVKAYTRAMDTSNTGIDFSSWRDQGAEIEFGIPGAGTSKVDWWRKTWSPNEGAYNILPRKGYGKGLADWEVSLGLSVEDMTELCSESELGPWLSRVVE